MHARHSAQVFVQIAAYRDPQLSPTLDSLFAQARHPDRLRVRVCWQRASSDSLPARWRRHPQVEIDDVLYRNSRGANWARARVQRHWQGEPYTLIIDSHLRFAPNWDERCFAWLAQLKTAGCRKPILSSYPPDFDPVTYPYGRRCVPLKLYKESYIEGLLLHFAGFPLPLWTWLQAPVPADFLALGFLFAEGSFNADVPFDPCIYFFGDEITTGLRAFSHGYDFFHPHRVIAWHAYNRRTRRCHWEDHDRWSTLDRSSLLRVKRLFQGRVDPKYPMGKVRSLREYVEHIGMPLVLA